MKSKGKKADETHLPRMIPASVLELAQKGKGTEPCFIMAKTLAKTDLRAGQNRLLIPAAFVKAHLIPFLSDEERAAANLLDRERKRKRPSTEDEDLEGCKTKKMKSAESGGGVLQEPGEGEASEDKKNEKTSKKKKKEAGRKHGGLHLPVYVGANKWKAYVIVTRWDSTNGTVLKGGEYSTHLARWSGVKVGDKVELWAFREGEMGRPCFILHRITEGVTECVQGGGVWV